MLYSYEAKDAQGKRVSGTVEAPDERGAARHVQSEGYFLLRLSAAAPVAAAAGAGAPSVQSIAYNDPTSAPASLTSAQPLSPGRWLLTKIVYPIWTGVSLRDMAVMYRQFAALTDAGVPLQRAISSMQNQLPNSVLSKCLRDIGNSVNAGGTISEGMAQYPWIFPEYQRAAIIAGEAVGNLDTQFRRLAKSLEDEFTLRSTIKREMFMPVINLSALFLLPPLVYLFFGNVGEYVRQAFEPLLTTAGVIFGVYVVCRIASGFRWLYDALLSIIPGLGPSVRMVAFARFGRTLASMYAAGINVVRAIQYAIDSCGNTYLAGRMAPMIPMLQRGEGITESFYHTRIFPPMVMSMIGTGEESGNLDAMMDKVASFYEEEAKLRLHQLSTALAAITAIAVGIRILIIVVQFYTKLYGGMLQDAG